MVDSFDPEVNYFDLAISIIMVDSSNPKVDYSSKANPSDMVILLMEFSNPKVDYFSKANLSHMTISLLVDSSNPEVDCSNMAISILRFPTDRFFNQEVYYSNMAIPCWWIFSTMR